MLLLADLPRTRIKVVVGTDAAVAGAVARRLAASLGFATTAAGEIAIAVAELAANQVRHAGGGEIEMGGCEAGFEVIAIDRGPGMGRKRLEAYTTQGGLSEAPDRRSGGLGCGLGAVRRMMHEMTMDNVPGGGLRVRAVKRGNRGHGE